MAKKIKKYKVGIDSETYAISMVECPAIESDFVALAKEEEKKVFLQSDEKFMCYGAALIPDKEIYRNDGENEFYISFTKDSIEKMSQDFMKEYRQHNVTLDHETEATDITIVESWLKADSYRDKSLAIGLDETLPVGTWFVGMKVNQIDVWERIKKGELRGFSVESLISLEDFNKQETNEMIMEENENFWTKMKSILTDVFNASALKNTEEDADSGVIDVEELFGEEAFEEVPAEPVSEPSEAVAEPVVEDTPEPEQKPVTEPEKEPETQPDNNGNPLEEVIKNLQEEIKALKKGNDKLLKEVKEMSKQPSANPVNTNAKTSQADTYSAWREQMRGMIG